LHFEIIHELDAPLDAVELAVLSPDLGSMMAKLLPNVLESVETLEHAFSEGNLRRVLRFQASAPLAMFRGYDLARDALSWEEESVYRLVDHASTWKVAPRPKYRRYFQSSGTYKLEAVPEGRTRRTVAGDIAIKASLFTPIVLRMTIAEVRKMYDAEAETLRRLSTL
jgi:hypothetical protein